MYKFLLDKRVLNFVVIAFLSLCSILWCFYIFKSRINIEFIVSVIALRCVLSFVMLRDYKASWSKSTPKTFLRKALINVPVLVIVVIAFHGKVYASLMFSELMLYLFLINLAVYLYCYIVNRSGVDKTVSVVIYGAGAAGMKIYQELSDTKFRVKMFVDDDKALQQRSIDGKKVVSLEYLKSRLLTVKYDMLVIAIPSASKLSIKNIHKSLEHDFDKIKILPELSDVLQDENFMSQLKHVSVYDLLSRDLKSLDSDNINIFLNNKTVLITGAGGSIGSEISRQCIKYKAKQLILIDHSEYNLYQISQELSEYDIKSMMVSVCDKDQLAKVFAKYSPDIVFHAAAYKHVPLVEDNIYNSIKNNIIGTKNTIDTAIKYNVDSFILVSTDKAVRPTNVMGATKRVCELYLQNVESQNTKLAAVRFGNVLGSSGSVIPRFQEQLKNNKPLTVTHPDITRYFMLIPEACELVLQAGAIAKKSEIFVLDMGEPVKIMDLAKQFRRLAGREDAKIEITGLRPGEKLYEELLIDETDVRTDCKDIFIGKKTFYDIDKLNTDIDGLLKTKSSVQQLQKIVPEFDHRP